MNEEIITTCYLQCVKIQFVCGNCERTFPLEKPEGYPKVKPTDPEKCPWCEATFEAVEIVI